MGIGSLLLDGIGDTIRVSLTEDAWNEIDPCRRIIALASSYEGKGGEPFVEMHRDIEIIKRRPVQHPKDIAMHRDGTVILGLGLQDVQGSNLYKKLGCDGEFGRPKLKLSSVDAIFIKDSFSSSPAVHALKELNEIGVSLFSNHPKEGEVLLQPIQEAINAFGKKSSIDRFSISPVQRDPFAVIIKDESPDQWTWLEQIKPSIIVLSPSVHRLHYSRRFFDWLRERKIQIPVIIRFHYSCSEEDLVIQSAAEFGSLFCDGLGEGIWIDGPYELEFLRNLSFNILQAARMRTSKTDFISCPSCGRTLFDLQDVSKRIRSRTSHLPGVKIAIMGCIVNGPGEMADADFGYVGSKPGMIDLYVGKECVEKDISFAEADDRLIELIRKHRRWVEPERFPL